MMGVSSFGAEVSMVCDGWVVLTISDERKTSVWIRGMVPSRRLSSTRSLDHACGVAMTARGAQSSGGKR